MAKKRSMESAARVAFFIFLIAVIAVAVAKYYPSAPAPEKQESVFNRTLENIAVIDNEHTMRFKDYYYGMEYIRFNPRYPQPLNPEDIPDVIAEFEGLKDDSVMGDAPSTLVIDMRINLLNAEKYYKLSMKYPLKGFVDDGFTCKDLPDVIEATGNLNKSVEYGRLAVEKMKELFENYRAEAEMVDVSLYRYRSINQSFDELSDKARKNQNTISYFCLEDYGGDYVDTGEFVQAKDLVEHMQMTEAGNSSDSE